MFKGINVVSIAVPDLDEARRFYRDVLALGEPIYDLPDAGWIEFGSGSRFENIAVTKAEDGWKASAGTTIALTRLWATDATVSGRELSDILRESDTWAVWIPYQSGLWLTAAGLLAYFGALAPIPEEYEVAFVVVLTVIAALVVGIVAGVRLRRDHEGETSSQHRAPRRLGKRKRQTSAAG